jgi:subtilisin family serine protease
LLFRLAFWGISLLLVCLLVPATTSSTSNSTIHHSPFTIHHSQLSFPKLTPGLLAELNANDEAEALILVHGRPDLTPARALSTKLAKGRFVVATLRATADETQASLRQMLDSRGVDYQAFWIVNMLWVRGDRALIFELAGRPEVARLDINPANRSLDSVAGERPSPRVMQVATTPWGVSLVGAPLAWERGVRGQGIVVAGNDTGVDWNHEALKDTYRGWDGQAVDHRYNWHDAWDKTPLEPSDDNGHGTHTIGTAAGGGPQAVGVAPDARWIACRNMNNGVGTPASYVDCFQFFLAPTDLNGENPRPDLAPHVINNSWACIESEGCYPDDPMWEDTIRPAVEALTEAGIAVVVSAGNAGPGCGSVRFPPAIYGEALSVGAIGPDQQVAPLSSRGPVTIDGSDIPAPDLVAPGIGVVSSYPVDDYIGLNGTSMAAPHVAGAIALVWSAEPRLVGHLAVTEQVLRASATPAADSTCGGDGDGRPNNAYGWGVINADAAVRIAETLQELSGTVADTHGHPLPAADVRITDLTWGIEVNLRTDPDGRYATLLLPGDYRIVASTAEHFGWPAVVRVPADGPATHDITLMPLADLIYRSYFPLLAHLTR